MLKTITVSALITYTDNALKTAAYEAGLKAIREIGFWNYQTADISPDTTEFSEGEAAELYLSAGRLYGYYSITFKHAQEIAKNLLTIAYDKFCVLGDREKQLICSNSLGVIETRIGTYEEAKVWLEHSLSFTEFAPDNPNRLETFIVESLIKIPNGESRAVVSRLRGEHSNFQSCGDLRLQGLYFMNLGHAESYTGDSRSALKHQKRASDIFERSGHTQLFSYVQNNIAYYYHTIGDTRNGFKYAKSALELAGKIFDIRLQGCALDTLALLHLDTGDLQKALGCAKQSIAFLEKTECYRYLLDSLTTKIKILWALSKKARSFTVYGSAMRIAQDFCTAADCDRLTQTLVELSDAIPVPRGTKERVWEIEITTDYNEHLGLHAGAVVFVKETKVENGDLAAIRIKETGEIFIGKIEFVFGLVSIETGNAEPEPFDESKVTVLGKVISYTENEKTEDGKLIVFEL